jgi:hypothetical protein
VSYEYKREIGKLELNTVGYKIRKNALPVVGCVLCCGAGNTVRFATVAFEQDR